MAKKVTLKAVSEKTVLEKTENELKKELKGMMKVFKSGDGTCRLAYDMGVIRNALSRIKSARNS